MMYGSYLRPSQYRFERTQSRDGGKIVPSQPPISAHYRVLICGLVLVGLGLIVLTILGV